MTQRRKRDGDFSVGRTTERDIQEVISFGYEFYQSKHDDIKIKTNRKQVKNG